MGKVLIVVAFVKRKIEGGSKVIRVLSKITQQVNGRVGAEVWHWDFQVYCAAIMPLLQPCVSGQIILILMLIPIVFITFRSCAKHFAGIIPLNPQHFGEKD